jgi:hypothetical protein
MSYSDLESADKALIAPDLFAVDVSGALPQFDASKPVVFHGVNKSGSLAMSKVLFDAYTRAGRETEFVSTYQNRPREYDKFLELLGSAQGHGFYVSHYIYKAIQMPPGARLVSLLRNPMPRMLSVYGWVRRNYIRRNNSEDGLMPFEMWVRKLRFKHHTQMVQFAVGFSADRKALVKQMPAPSILELAKENLLQDFSWYGFAEYFEESIFAFASMCGIKEVAAWQKDTRNKWRVPLVSVEQPVLDRLRDQMRYEIEFYDWALDLFKKRIAQIRFAGDFEKYKAACLQEYGERIL